MNTLKYFLTTLLFVSMLCSCKENIDTASALTPKAKQASDYVSMSPIGSSYLHGEVSCLGQCASGECHLTGVIISGSNPITRLKCSCGDCLMEFISDGISGSSAEGLNEFENLCLFLEELSAFINEQYGGAAYKILSLEYIINTESEYALIYEFQTEDGTISTVMFMYTPEGKYKIDCHATQCDCREEAIFSQGEIVF